MLSLDLRLEFGDLAIELLEVVQQTIHWMPERCRPHNRFSAAILRISRRSSSPTPSH